jgi:hypothetical protein
LDSGRQVITTQPTSDGARGEAAGYYCASPSRTIAPAGDDGDGGSSGGSVASIYDSAPDVADMGDANVNASATNGDDGNDDDDIRGGAPALQLGGGVYKNEDSHPRDGGVSDRHKQASDSARRRGDDGDDGDEDLHGGCLPVPTPSLAVEVFGEALAHLRGLRGWFATQREVHLLGSSVLIVYEGDDDAIARQVGAASNWLSDMGEGSHWSANTSSAPHGQSGAEAMADSIMSGQFGSDESGSLDTTGRAVIAEPGTRGCHWSADASSSPHSQSAAEAGAGAAGGGGLQHGRAVTLHSRRAVRVCVVDFCNYVEGCGELDDNFGAGLDRMIEMLSAIMRGEGS